MNDLLPEEDFATAIFRDREDVQARVADSFMRAFADLDDDPEEDLTAPPAPPVPDRAPDMAVPTAETPVDRPGLPAPVSPPPVKGVQPDAQVDDPARPRLPEKFDSDDVARFVQDTVAYHDPSVFFAYSLPQVRDALGIDEDLDEAAITEWGAMTPDERKGVIDRLAGDPETTLTDALMPEDFDTRDIIGGADDAESPAGGLPVAAAAADIATSDAPVAKAEDDAGPGRARRVLSDVGLGAREAGTQLLGGVRDATYAALTGIAAFDEWASDAMGLPKLQLLNEQGAFDIKLLSAEDGDVAEVLLPGIRQPKSVTGGMVRGISQFLTGFVGGGRVLRGFGWAANTARGGRAVSQAIFSDFAAFDGHEERLSNLIEEYPSLQNPVTAYLAADIDDGELEGRLKNVAEGMLSDVLVTGLIASLRGVRAARKAKKALGGETYRDAQKRLAADTTRGQDVLQDASGLRPPDAPLTFRPDAPGLQDETRAYLKKLDETEARLSDPAAEVTDADAANALAFARIPTGEGDVYINWARIETGDDVRAVIQQLADASKAEIDEARRGVRTNTETAAAADRQNAWALLVEDRKGRPLNAEQTLALRRLWSSSGEKVATAARLVAKSPTAQNSFVFRRAMALHGAVQREVLAVRTETARALQQWRIPAGPGGVVARQMEEMVNVFGDVGVSRDLARRIVDLADAGEHGAIDQMARKGAAAATHDAVFEYWVNAVLSGPKTHMVNAISNMGVVVTNQLERAVGAKIGQLRGSVDAVEAAEAGAMLHGMLAALPDAFRFAGRSFASGKSGFGVQKIEMPRARSISTEFLANTRNRTFNKAMNLPVIAQGINALGSIVTLPGRALGASDEFFKTINYRMEVHANAARVAADDVRAGRISPADQKARMAELIAEPPEDVLIRAREFAQYSTFTDDAGRYANAFAQLRTKAPILRFVLPFLNTPANILRFATERSPGAMLLGDVRADIRAGGRRADMALAKMGLGSFTMLTAFDYAMNGQITGSGPDSKNERDALYRTGWQPNSIRIGDRYFAYNRLDPIGAQLGVAANMAEMALNSDVDPGEDYDEIVYGAIGAVGQHMMDKAYVQGLSDLFTAMSEPQRFAVSYFEKFAGSFVPAIVREGANVIDPVLRRSSNTLETMKARIPGVSGNLPARHDIWGREIAFQSGLGAGYDAVSPIYSSRLDPEPIDQEMLKIGYFPGLPSTLVTIDGETFGMKNQPEAYERYVVLQGATKASEYPGELTSRGKPSTRSLRMEAYGDLTLMEVLNAVVTGNHEMSDEYASGTNEDKKSIIERTISDYRYFARRRLIEEFSDVFTPGSGRSKGGVSGYSRFVEPVE